MQFTNKLLAIIDKFNAIESKLMDVGNFSSKEYASLSKERSQMEEVVALAKRYLKVMEYIKESETILNDPGSDPELKEMAEEQIAESKEEIETLQNQLKIALLPKDAADEKNVILEIRAGTGGDEAALFAMDLFRMYQRYSEGRGWRFEVLSLQSTGLDGCKEATALISGNGVFARLKFEAGVHRVQRVPETESSGRVHTSAATVAVLPEAEEVDINIDEKDLRIDVFRASGSGGQHVNTTESAVRITHIPTNIVVSIQDEKSQHKNKDKAMKILRSRLYEHERAELNEARSAMRKGMLGSGDRSEKIRTYNYPQSRITDHRIHYTNYNLHDVVNNGELDDFIEALIAEDQAKKLAEEV